MQKKMEKVCLRTKFDLQLKTKTKKFWGNFKTTWKIFCVPSKKMPVIQFPYL